MPFFEHGGERLHYRTQGDGPAVLLIHSLGGASGMWDSTWAALAGRYRLVAWDARGHGRSSYDPAANGRFTLERSADDAMALLDHLGIDRFAAVGISMGGHTALRIASAHATRVSALVAADCSLGGRPGGSERVAGVKRSIEEQGMSAFARQYVSSRLEPSTPQAVMERYAAWVEAMPPDAYVDTLTSIVAQDLQAVVSGIRAPTLVLVGEHDSSSTPAMAKEIQTAIAHAELHEIQNANHFSVLDQPAAFDGVVSCFLDKHCMPTGR